MARPDTLETRMLHSAQRMLEDAAAGKQDDPSTRLSILEAVSCRHSGIELKQYQSITGYLRIDDFADDLVESLHGAIAGSGIPFSMALSSLARIDTGEVETKRNGAVYTDFRLANYLARCVMDDYVEGRLIDPSCGTSIILAACAVEYGMRHGSDASSFVAGCLYGIDLSDLAIRGSILSLASLLNTPEQLRKLVSHFACEDSLLLEDTISSFFGLSGFSIVVGNPPWERVRPSRNEFARANGVVVDYGQSIETMPDGYEAHRKRRQAASANLAASYGLKGGMDLYRAFLNLSVDICAEGGSVALFLPAGLIRSKGLADARGKILQEFGQASVSVFMNHARFFPIDTRFKFVLAHLMRRGETCEAAVEVRYCSGRDESVSRDSAVMLDAAMFCDSSGALGAPEVKTDDEMRVLRTMWGHGERMSSHPLFAGVRPVRELDMTLDRGLFESEGGDDKLPLIEGRMVSQFRCRCKAYLGGSGRSAKWAVVPPGSNRIEPQYYVSQSNLSDSLIARCANVRVGFCDIAGQTNERAMQAALIPAGCACGNKVPTLLFDDEERTLLWLGIVNSFAFDWVVRRYITTTINYFILENLPFPTSALDDERGREIIANVRQICALDEKGDGWTEDDTWEYACKRARLDELVLGAYGLGTDDFEIIAQDFPLVDQVNQRMWHSVRPTMELLRWRMASSEESRERARSACQHGALPYVPNEHARSLMR